MYNCKRLPGMFQILDWPECDTTNKRDRERLMKDLNNNDQVTVVSLRLLTFTRRRIPVDVADHFISTFYITGFMNNSTISNSSVELNVDSFSCCFSLRSEVKPKYFERCHCL